MASEQFTARQGKWIGAKMGVLAVKPSDTGNRDWLDMDWVHSDKLKSAPNP